MAPAFAGTWQPFIWDRTCARPLATHPDDRPGNRLDRLRGPRHPYSVLLPVGFTVPSMSPWPRWALTPPFHPYLPRKAVCFLWHFPWGRPRRTLSGTVFPWSPDFPPSRARAAVRPTGEGEMRAGAPGVKRNRAASGQLRAVIVRTLAQ